MVGTETEDEFYSSVIEHVTIRFLFSCNNSFFAAVMPIPTQA